ncbi:hypothetical protein CLOM_g16680 [Closterium sp. NIES-68]|nr:hypothetical protein CLOM_g16680 [Closterium sp. NIES-68]GJP82799.1 hypothetical protein CLOP_g13029 [Closterium sp. NIES-67]
MWLRRSRLPLCLLLLACPLVAEGLRVPDSNSATTVTLIGDKTLRADSPARPIGALVTREGIPEDSLGSYESHAVARLRGNDSVTAAIRIVVFRNATSANVRYSLRLSGLTTPGFPTSVRVIKARTSTPVLSLSSAYWSNVTNSPPFDLGSIVQGDRKVMKVRYKYTASGWCYDAEHVAAEAGLSVAGALRRIMAAPRSYHGVIEAPGGRATGMFAVGKPNT